MITRIGINQPDPQGISTGQSSPSITPFKTTAMSDPESDAYSGETSIVSTLTDRALQTPETRKGLVENLRAQVASGQYWIDRQGVADAMLS
jgi:anti-sigma28 factor (negative regulator of flagellin synthesis)